MLAVDIDVNGNGSIDWTPEALLDALDADADARVVVHQVLSVGLVGRVVS